MTGEGLHVPQAAPCCREFRRAQVDIAVPLPGCEPIERRPAAATLEEPRAFASSDCLPSAGIRVWHEPLAPRNPDQFGRDFRFLEAQDFGLFRPTLRR